MKIDHYIQASLNVISNLALMTGGTNDTNNLPHTFSSSFTTILSVTVSHPVISAPTEPPVVSFSEVSFLVVSLLVKSPVGGSSRLTSSRGAWLVLHAADRIIADSSDMAIDKTNELIFFMIYIYIGVIISFFKGAVIFEGAI